jgi:hypothetical protein
MHSIWAVGSTAFGGCALLRTAGGAVGAALLCSRLLLFICRGRGVKLDYCPATVLTTAALRRVGCVLSSVTVGRMPVGEHLWRDGAASRLLNNLLTA